MLMPNVEVDDTLTEIELTSTLTNSRIGYAQLSRGETGVYNFLTLILHTRQR